jgi:uncharacterized SAM-binding protein YcdF (DUF218 family)
LTRSRRGWATAVLLSLFAAGLVLVARPALLDAPSHYLVLRDEFGRVDAALVMAGDPGYERTTTALRLVLEGRARLLILTGGEPGPGDSASSLLAWARSHGIRDDQIRVESVSTGTRSSMEAVRPILEAEGVKTLALVTSPYHQKRANGAAVKVFGPGVRVFNLPARPSFWAPEGWWKTSRSRRIVVSEYLKLGYYGLRGWI